MTRHFRRILSLLALALILSGLGCRSTTRSRSGVHSVEHASVPMQGSVIESVSSAKRDPNPQVIPASYTQPTSAGADCKH